MTKKLTTLLAALAIAMTLSAPAFARKPHPKKTVVSTSWNKHKKGQMRDKKKEAVRGKKKGQQAIYFQFGRAKKKGAAQGRRNINSSRSKKKGQ